jgi:arylsulfatase
MHAKPADIAKYAGRYDAGWDALRVERHKRMVELGLIDAKWELSPNDRDWESVKPENRDWFRRRMEVYAAMVDSMDQGIGRIVASLRRSGRLDNTLILYLQDNGGCQEEIGSKGPIKPDPSQPVALKPMRDDELQYDMIPKVTRDGRPVRTGFGVMPGPADTYIAYGIEWANASNTPFRMYKHFVHEGGVATPLIAHWPAGVKRTGELERQPGHLIDIMATCVDLAGAAYPTEFAGEAIQPPEGVSLAPAFAGKALAREQPIYFEHEGNRAVRQGKWKLVARGANGPWELYDMDADRTEMHDLAVSMPAKAEELAALWRTWAERANVLPLTPYNRRP